jgi:Tripartite tricarboxylate transporter TctB family
VLGDSIERYMLISVERYGLAWMARPIVAILFLMAIVGLLRPLIFDIRRQGGVMQMLRSFQAPTFRPEQLFTMFMLAVVATMVAMASRWDFSAKIVPLVIGTVALTAAALSLFNEMCRKPARTDVSWTEQAQHEVEAKIHMDLGSDTAHLGVRTVAQRAARFFGYLIGFMAVMAVIGLIPTAAIFVVLFMRWEGPERWSLVIAYATVLVLSIYVVFHVFMAVPWPPTLMGTWFPALKAIPLV